METNCCFNLALVSKTPEESLALESPAAWQRLRDELLQADRCIVGSTDPHPVGDCSHVQRGPQAPSAIQASRCHVSLINSPASALMWGQERFDAAGLPVCGPAPSFPGQPAIP